MFFSLNTGNINKRNTMLVRSYHKTKGCIKQHIILNTMKKKLFPANLANMTFGGIIHLLGIAKKVKNSQGKTTCCLDILTKSGRTDNNGLLTATQILVHQQF